MKYTITWNRIHEEGNYREGVDLYEINKLKKDGYVNEGWGINWAAYGTQDVEETKRFMGLLHAAIEEVNRRNIDKDYLERLKAEDDAKYGVK